MNKSRDKEIDMIDELNCCDIGCDNNYKCFLCFKCVKITQNESPILSIDF